MEHLYQLADLNIHSSLPLPELRVLQNHLLAKKNFTINFEIRSCAEAPKDYQSFPLLFEKTDLSGAIWLKVYSDSKLFIFDFGVEALFSWNKGNRQLICYPNNSLETNTLRHLLLDHVCPYILSTTKPLVIHSSALVKNETSIIFPGKSGVGKSSLAASLIRLGWKLYSDDYIALTEQLEIVGSYSGLRLWPDSKKLTKALLVSNQEMVSGTSNKMRFQLDSSQFREVGNLPRAIVILKPDNCSKIPRLHPESDQAAFIELLSYSFLLEQNRSKLQFQIITELLKQAKLYYLSYQKLPETPEKIAELVERKFI